MASIAAALALLGCDAGVGAQTSHSPAEALMDSVAVLVLEGAAGADARWTRPWMRSFTLLSRGGETLLVTSRVPPMSWGPARESHDVPGSGRVAHHYPADQQGPPERFSFIRLGDTLTVAWALVDSVYGIKDPVLANTIAVYHEVFHTFQIERGWIEDLPMEATLELPRALVVESAFQEMAEKERRLLADALALPPTESPRSLVRDYLSAKRERLRAIPREYAVAEAYMETREGSAQLIGYQAGLAAVRGSAEGVSEIVRQDLLGTPPFDSRPGFGTYRTWHVHAVGAAIALLLDRVGVSWRQEVEDQATLVELLRRWAEG